MGWDGDVLMGIDGTNGTGAENKGEMLHVLDIGIGVIFANSIETAQMFS